MSNSNNSTKTRRTTFFSISLLLVLLELKTVNCDYWDDRALLVQADETQSVGAKIILNSNENKVNNFLKQLKLSECQAGFNDPSTFPPALHFFSAKEIIEKSKVFQVIQMLPKGGLLHAHDGALVSSEFVYNLTFRENLYACVVNNNLKLQFFNQSGGNEECDWELLKTLRERNSTFDEFVKTQLSLVCDDPQKAYPSINPVWSKFSDIFSTVFGLIQFKPVFQEYFYQALQELYDDNVMYIELRTLLPAVYDLSGKTYSKKEVVEMYKETEVLFKENNPGFLGAKLIYAPFRRVDNATVNEYVQEIIELQELFPDFISGFDLVGQEDLGYPLSSFIPQLLELSSRGIKFVLHAAETNWNGASTDDNLIDAVLLNTTRIGHGYGILKHPKILQEVKSRQIALEISPISNQVLKLVDDIRNHPGSFLIAAGYPVVITSDDPGFWGAKGLSYDWYMAFMGMASWEADLRLLKQLAMNSLAFSGMSEGEKYEALTQWQVEWNKFIGDMLEQINGDKSDEYCNDDCVVVLNV